MERSRSAHTSASDSEEPPSHARQFSNHLLPRRLSSNIAKAIAASNSRKQSATPPPSHHHHHHHHNHNNNNNNNNNNGRSSGVAGSAPQFQAQAQSSAGGGGGSSSSGGGGGGPPELPPPPRRSNMRASIHEASMDIDDGLASVVADTAGSVEGPGGEGGSAPHARIRPKPRNPNVDIAKEPRSCLAVMISRAVNVQVRSKSRLIAQIHNPAARQARQARRSTGAPMSSSDLWETVKNRDESDLWLPDFSKTRSINVEGFFTGIDYAPRVFESIRQHFDIRSGHFAADMGRLGEGKEGEGKSKQLFFQTENGKYIIKTIKDLELDYFLSILGDYYYHMLANKNTLICRFYGLYSVTMPKLKRTFTFVVMSNNFDSPLHIPPTYHKFDLKGSTKNRLCSDEDMEDGYVGKDLNFESTLYVDADVKSKFMMQLKIDAWFLQGKNLMDYSLLLGIAPTAGSGIPSPSSGASNGPFQSIFQTVCGGMPVSIVTPPKMQPEEIGDDDSESDENPAPLPVVKRAVVFMGIIDILQPYSMKKQMETQMKAKPGDAKDFSYSAISAVPAQAYAYRFLRYVNSWMRTTRDLPRTSLSRSPANNGAVRRAKNSKNRRMSSALF